MSVTLHERHPDRAERNFTLSTTLGLLRSVSEAFGPTGGAALIYSITALLLCLTRGLPDPRVLPRRYLLVGGGLFVGYEICLALAIGLAHDRTQSLELGMINYLWPSLTIVLAIPFNQQRFRHWLWPGLLLSLCGIVWVMKGTHDSVATQMALNMAHNPLAYLLALAAALAWALYNNVTRRYACGSNGVSLFLSSPRWCSGLNLLSAHSRKRCTSAQPRWRKCCSWVPLPPWPTLPGTTAFSREICPCWRPPPVLRPCCPPC